MGDFTGDRAGSRLARHLLPAVILVPLTLGWIRLKGQQLGLYGTEFGLALFALSNVGTFAALVWWNAHLLNRTDALRRSAAVRVRQLNRLYAVLSDVNQAIVRVRPIPALFEKVCHITVEQGDFRMAWIGLPDPETRRVNISAHAGLAGDYLDKLQIDLDDPSRGYGPSGTSLRSGEHVICNDIEHDPRMMPWREDALRLGYRASAAFPLKVKNEVRGTFHLYTDRAGFFNDEETRLLDELALDISFAMEFAEQEAQRQQAGVALGRYAQRLEILHEIDSGIIEATSIQALVGAALKHVRQIIPCQRVILVVVDDPTDEWVAFAVDINHPTELGEGTRVRIPPNWFEGFGAGNARLIDDIRLMRETHPRYQQLLNEGM